MVLLEDHGIFTSNVAERPGARVSLRLRPTAAEVERFGGPERVVEAVANAFAKLATLLDDNRAASNENLRRRRRTLRRRHGSRIPLRPMKDTRTWQHQFPVTRDWTYLDIANKAPLPLAVKEAWRRFLDETA